MAGSTAGAVIGQVLIPVPIVGGFIGGITGSFIGKYGCVLTIRTQTLRISEANHVLVGGVCIAVILNLENLL